MTKITNQDIIYKLGGIEADIATMKDDIKQVKKDTAFVPVMKIIVFGLIGVVAFTMITNVVNFFSNPHSAQANAQNSVIQSKIPGTGQ